MRWAAKARFLAFALLLLSAGSGVGQTVDIKRSLPAATPPLCPPTPPVSVSPSAQDRANADALLARATQLTLLGEDAQAVDLLLEAEELNPASPDVAYRLGVAEREMGRVNEAVIHYCRYLTLSPGAADGDDVRQLVSELVPPSPPLYGSQAANRFRDGVEAWDGGEVEQAYAAFTDVVQMAPSLPEGAYNRGLVAAYQGRNDQAAGDFSEYVTLRPTADDRDLVEEWQSQLGSPVEVRNPTTTLAGGLVVPGLGQLMTGSRVGGFSLLAVGTGAAAVGLLNQTVSVLCLSVPVNNECPPDQIKARTKEREFLVPGLAIYGGVAVVGAVMAYRKTKDNNALASRAMRFQPRPGSSSAGAAFHGPELYASATRVGVTWLRLSF